MTDIPPGGRVRAMSSGTSGSATLADLSQGEKAKLGKLMMQFAAMKRELEAYKKQAAASTDARTDTHTDTHTASDTPSVSDIHTASQTPSVSDIHTASDTHTVCEAPSVSDTPSVSDIHTASDTRTVSDIHTVSDTASVSASEREEVVGCGGELVNRTTPHTPSQSMSLALTQPEQSTVLLPQQTLQHMIAAMERCRRETLASREALLACVEKVASVEQRSTSDTTTTTTTITTTTADHLSDAPTITTIHDHDTSTQLSTGGSSGSQPSPPPPRTHAQPYSPSQQPSSPLYQTPAAVMPPLPRVPGLTGLRALREAIPGGASRSVPSEKDGYARTRGSSGWRGATGNVHTVGSGHGGSGCGDGSGSVGSGDDGDNSGGGSDISLDERRSPVIVSEVRTGGTHSCDTNATTTLQHHGAADGACASNGACGRNGGADVPAGMVRCESPSVVGYEPFEGRVGDENEPLPSPSVVARDRGLQSSNITLPSQHMPSPLSSTRSSTDVASVAPGKCVAKVTQVRTVSTVQVTQHTGSPEQEDEVLQIFREASGWSHMLLTPPRLTTSPTKFQQQQHQQQQRYHLYQKDPQSSIPVNHIPSSQQPYASMVSVSSGYHGCASHSALRGVSTQRLSTPTTTTPSHLLHSHHSHTHTPSLSVQMTPGHWNASASTTRLQSLTPPSALPIPSSESNIGPSMAPMSVNSQSSSDISVTGMPMGGSQGVSPTFSTLPFSSTDKRALSSDGREGSVSTSDVSLPATDDKTTSGLSRLGGGSDSSTTVERATKTDAMAGVSTDSPAWKDPALSFLFL